MKYIHRSKSRTLELMKFICTIFLICCCLICILSIPGSALNATTIRGKLWESGGISTVSTSEALTGNALLKYAKAGIFGSDCATYAANEKENTTTLLQNIQNKCPSAKKFYLDAKNYANIVEARMSTGDKTKRVDDATARFSNLAQEVFSLMTGFGLLTAMLVFTVLFMRIAWMPSHVIEKRKAAIDIATSAAAVVLLGNIWLAISLFQSSFNRFWQTFAVYSKDWRTVANMVLLEYKGFIVGLSGIATLFVLAMFIINFASVAINGSNVQKRSEKVGNLIMCAIAAACLGSITLVCGFFWNLFST